MLGRRILRIKAFKTLYAYAVTGKMTLDEAMDNLDKSCEATRDLYLYMLATLLLYNLYCIFFFLHDI